MTAAQTLAALLLPLIVVADDYVEIGEAIADIWRSDIEGEDVGRLADALAVALDEGIEAIEDAEFNALTSVGLLLIDEDGAHLPDFRAARRALGWM